MLEPKSVEVYGQKYTVNPFTPTEALEFIHRLIFARATGQGMGALGRIAISQCLDSGNNDLSDKVTFKAHFTKYPESMLELERVAIETLTAPFERADKKEAVGAEA